MIFYLTLGEPVSLHIWVQLLEEFGAALRPGLSKAALVEEEVDAEIRLLHYSPVDYREAANACVGFSWVRSRRGG